MAKQRPDISEEASPRPKERKVSKDKVHKNKKSQKDGKVRDLVDNDIELIDDVEEQEAPAKQDKDIEEALKPMGEGGWNPLLSTSSEPAMSHIPHQSVETSQPNVEEQAAPAKDKNIEEALKPTGERGWNPLLSTSNEPAMSHIPHQSVETSQPNVIIQSLIAELGNSRKDYLAQQKEDQKEARKAYLAQQKEARKVQKEARKDYLAQQKQARKDYLAQQEKLVESTKEIVQLQGKLAVAIDEKLQVEGLFNVRGALERIVYIAESIHKCSNKGGNQAKLNELAKRPEFQAILEREVAERRLVLLDVQQAIKGLYGLVSRHAHGNDGKIIILRKPFGSNERAGMACFMKLQQRPGWPNPLEWREEPAT